MPLMSHSPVTFTWNFASSTSASDLLHSSRYGVSVVPLKFLGRARLGISRRVFTVSAKVGRGKKRHEYPWDGVPDPQTDGELCRAIHPFKPLKEKPKPVILEFEKPLIAARKKIMEIKKLVSEAGLELSDAMVSLENKLQKSLTDAYMNLTPIQRVYIARHPHRPTCLDHIFNITDDVFLELHGDRHGYDDPAIVTGLGRMNDKTYMFIGHQKGRNTKESIQRNFGMPTPHGYRKALRMMHYADHYGFPIVTFIDTPGAFADLKSERLNQGEAIAQNLITMFGLKVPIISIVIGEGGSGGALAIACANKLLMLENAVFYVASPEACAAILYKSAKEAPKAARKLKITASELCKLKIADGIIPEPLGGAHTDPYWTSQQIKSAILKSMDELTKMDEQELLKHRQLKFRNMGQVGEGVPIDPFKKRNMKKREAKEGFHFKKRILDPKESFGEHMSNELSEAKNLSVKNKKECKLEKEIHVKSMDEEVEEESENEGIDDDFFEESEDEGVVEESGNEEVDQDFFEESKDEGVGKESRYEGGCKESEDVLDQAEINEEFVDVLYLSETEEIEAVKKETEELERGEKIEAMKKKLEELERAALDSTEIKKIEAMKKKIEELERGEEIIEALKKGFEELECGEEIEIEPLKKEIEEIDSEIEAEEKEIEESERVEEIGAVKKESEEWEQAVIKEEVNAEFVGGLNVSEIEEEIEAVKKKIEEFKRAEMNEEVEEEFVGVLDPSEIDEIEAVKKEIEELERFDISEEVDEKFEDILGQSDIEKKTEALKKEIEGSGASSLEDLPEDMKNRLLQLKKAVSGAVSDDRVAYMRVDHALTLSEFRKRTTAINHEIKDAIDNSPDLIVKIERLELEVKRVGKRSDLEMRNKIQQLELEIKQGIDEALKFSEKYQKLVADLPKPKVKLAGMHHDFETIRKMLVMKQQAEQGTKDVLNSSENYEKLMAEISEIDEPSGWSDGSLEENVNQNDSNDHEVNLEEYLDDNRSSV